MWTRLIGLGLAAWGVWAAVQLAVGTSSSTAVGYGAVFGLCLASLVALEEWFRSRRARRQ